jgi:hypothetical protein
MSDLLTADNKEDGTRRTAKRKERVVTRSIGRVTGAIFMIAVSAMVSWSAEEQQIDKTAGETQREPCIKESP